MSLRDADYDGGTLGILGGMGPAATSAFYQRLVVATPAERDSDHVPIVIWADPRIPDRTDAIVSGGDDPTPWLRRGARALRGAGASTLIVPCLTSHHFVREVAEEVQLRLVDMVKHTSRRLQADGHQAAGLLATTGTVRAGLFQTELAGTGVRLITPDESEQHDVMDAIRMVKAGRINDAKPRLSRAAETLRAAGAQAIVMGCTEVPLGLDRSSVDAELVDPIDIVIDHVVTTHRSAHGQATSSGDPAALGLRA